MDEKVYPRPLVEVGLDIADDLARTPHGSKCAGCGKPFNVVRKKGGVARALFMTPAFDLHTWSWLLCRKCIQEAKRNGNMPPAHLCREAEEEAALLYAKPGGAA